MQRNHFLGDLLTTLFDRRNLLRGKDDTRDIYQLCEALMSAEGEVSGFRLAATILERYQDLTEAEKLRFFHYLNDEMDIDAQRLARLSEDYAANPTPESFVALSEAAEPKRQELLRRLNQPAGATADLVAMRVDLLKVLRAHPELKRTNHDFVHLLRSWFNRGFLVLQQINWDTPARILDKIVAYEAVHEIDDWDDLRRRLYPPDRRCFAFFHPSMPEEPLIFVEVALTAEIPSSIDELLSDDRTPLEENQTKVAAFYSISNCQRGLTGVSFGNLLIKQVVAELSAELRNLDTFVTLSPIPGLSAWLTANLDAQDNAGVADAGLAQASQQILDGVASDAQVQALSARYLIEAKRPDGMPLDPVARFHLGNGAEVHMLHANADLSANGQRQSRGAMVNYLYDLELTEKNHENFATTMTVMTSKQAQGFASTALSPSKLKETAP